MVPPLLHTVPAFMQGLRWQLRPLYAAYLVAVLGWDATAFALAVFSLAIGWLIPPPVVKGIEGRFSVGFVEYEARDRKRPSGAAAHHPVIGRMFYPAKHGHSATAPYIAMGDRHGLTRRFMVHASPAALRPYLPSFILQHWAVTPMPASYAAAPWVPESPGERLPVVVFSHGLTASREKSTSLGLSLASAGAVVLLVEHTDESSTLARLHDGSTIEYDTRPTDVGDK